MRIRSQSHQLHTNRIKTRVQKLYKSLIKHRNKQILILQDSKKL